LRAGRFGGAFNAAGPPVIIYVSLPPWRQELIKVTLPGCYFASGLMVVAAPAPLTLGIYAGHFFFGKIREETYRRVVLILFLGLGMFTCWNAG
jgi:hypothetical protein